jgi:hypothetical protein
MGTIFYNTKVSLFKEISQNCPIVFSRYDETSETTIVVSFMNRRLKIDD